MERLRRDDGEPNPGYPCFPYYPMGVLQVPFRFCGYSLLDNWSESVGWSRRCFVRHRSSPDVMC
jgi:hypothetical protein